MFWKNFVEFFIYGNLLFHLSVHFVVGNFINRVAYTARLKLYLILIGIG